MEVIEAVITLWDQDENECSITDDERKLKALRALSAETERVAASGALHLVPAEQIRKLLGILRQPIQKGNVHAQRKDNVCYSEIYWAPDIFAFLKRVHFFVVYKSPLPQ